MKKRDLSIRFQIAKAELEDNMSDEQGCFDEIAQRIFILALGCEEMLDESSEDVMIQFNKSVKIVGIQNNSECEYIDGIYLSKASTEVRFSGSSLNGSKIYCYEIEDIRREDVIKVVDQLIEMCR